MKKQSGITLVALITTIIVLLILVGVAINVVTNNGIIGKARTASEKYKMESLKEKIELEISGMYADEYYEINKAFGDELSNRVPNLTFYKAESNELNGYIVDNNQKYNVTVKSNGKVVISKFNNDGEIIKENVKSLREDTTLTTGQTVFTEGYYSSGDGGNATYQITSSIKQEDNGKFIKLNNGLTAELQIQNKAINVKQYGAIANGTEDDTETIKKVFNQIDGTTCDTIIFGKGIYILTQTIDIPQGTYKGLKNSKIIIKNVTTKTDTDDKIGFKINNLSGNNNYKVIFDSLNISSDMPYSDKSLMMFRFYNTTGCEVKNCNFSSESTNAIGITALDFYSNNKDVLVDKCTSNITNSNENLKNTHIQLREYKADGVTQNVKISNCDFRKNGTDETLWIDGWLGKVDGIEISNCNLIDSGSVATSTIWIGATQSTSNISNVNMHDCTIEKEGYSYIVCKIGAKINNVIRGNTSNVKLTNNTFKINSSSDLKDGSSVIEISNKSQEGNESDIQLEGNTFELKSIVGSVITDRSTKNIVNLKNNTIKANEFSTNNKYFSGVIYGVNTSDGDKFTNLDGNEIVCGYLYRDTKNVKNVETRIISTGFFYPIKGGEYNIENCNVTTNQSFITPNVSSTGDACKIYLKNCQINNNKYLVSAWYNDKNSAVSDTANIYLYYDNNTTISNNKNYGSVIVNKL